MPIPKEILDVDRPTNTAVMVTEKTKATMGSGNGLDVRAIADAACP